MTVASSSRAWLAAAALLLACGSDDGTDAGDDAAGSGDDAADDDDDDDAVGDDDDDDDDDDAATGQVAFRFEVTGTVRESMNLEDTLDGSIYGGLFFTSEVSVTGPSDDAEQQGSIEAHDIDLTADEAVTEIVWTSEPLAPGNYTFLGYFDVDGSSDEIEEKDPESGDPVTLPTVNKFTIEAGETVELTVRFDLVFS